MSQLAKLFIVFFGSFLSLAVSAQESPEPASFGDYADQFVGKLDFPRITADTPLNMRCAGHVTKRGVFDTIICLGDPNFKGDSKVTADVGKEISEVVANVRVNAAKVDGSRVEVWYNFSVKYEIDGGEQHISVVDHHFRNGDHGSDFVAAQRYNGDLASCASRLSSAIFIEATVNESGQVQSVSPMNGASDKCADDLVASMQDSTYIPAHQNGAPVSSKYVEIFYKY